MTTHLHVQLDFYCQMLVERIHSIIVFIFARSAANQTQSIKKCVDLCL